MHLAWLFTVALLQAEHDPSSVELAVLASRSEIKSGKILLKYTFTGAMEKDVSDSIELQFDGTDRFMKVVNNGARELYPAGVEPKTSRYVLTPDLFMTHARENFPSQRRLAAYVDHLKAFEALRNRLGRGADDALVLEHRIVFDPRMIGCLPSSVGLFYMMALDSYIGAPGVRSGPPMVTMLKDLSVKQL